MEGSCNCGAIKLSASDEIKAVVNCHCTLCRKMNGASFSTYVVVPEQDFAIDGETLKTSKVSNHASKSFCSDCGSPIFNENPKLPGLKILHLGVLDTDIDLQPSINIFCDSQLSWVNRLNELANSPQGIA